MTDVTTTEPRAEVALRRAVDAFNRGDIETWFSTYADDAVYRVAGNNLVSGSYRGKDEIKAFFQRLFEVTEGTMKVDVVDILGSDSRAVFIFHVTATRQGKSLDDTGAMAFRLNDESKFAESWLMYSHQAAYDEFFG